MDLEKIKDLQKPIQFLIMALEEVIKSQKELFESNLYYQAYKNTIKESIIKTLESEN